MATWQRETAAIEAATEAEGVALSAQESVTLHRTLQDAAASANASASDVRRLTAAIPQPRSPVASM